MKNHKIVRINFKGGIISPGDLYNILIAAERAGITHVKFGLRQQLLLEVLSDFFDWFCDQLMALNIPFLTNREDYPNIVSSYPAEEIFISNNWLSEGIYKDIFDGFDYQPRLKVNISDSNQSFTPLLTGNINWVAHPTSPHYWYCLIRFPKTNTVYEAKELVYTNDLPRISKHIENLITDHSPQFYTDGQPDGDKLFSLVMAESYLTRSSTERVVLPGFNLPYYEGFNRYNNKYWLGIYRRDEMFSLDFLKALCTLCLRTKIGQICATPWKSLIIKSIDEKDRSLWNALLGQFQVNVRHAANELNFQVEDNCNAGLSLKNYLVKHLNKNDTRTFGICIGIKTRRKSEVFSSILIRRRSMFHLFGRGFFNSYDILCAHDFNPNKRTGFIFSKGNPKWLLPEQLRRAVFSYYQFVAGQVIPVQLPEKIKEPVIAPVYVHQCTDCLTVYNDPQFPFEGLPDSWGCVMCEAPKALFRKVDQQSLHLQPV